MSVARFTALTEWGCDDNCLRQVSGAASVDLAETTRLVTQFLNNNNDKGHGHRGLYGSGWLDMACRREIRNRQWMDLILHDTDLRHSIGMQY